VSETSSVGLLTRNIKLTGKVREVLGGTPGFEEKRMFGVAFMVNEKLCVSVRNSRIVCRVDPATVGELTKMKGCRTMRVGGRQYKARSGRREGVGYEEGTELLGGGCPRLRQENQGHAEAFRESNLVALNFAGRSFCSCLNLPYQTEWVWPLRVSRR
jgi:hypothetical protein